MKLGNLFMRFVCWGSGHPVYGTNYVQDIVGKDGIHNPILVFVKRCFCGKIYEELK